MNSCQVPPETPQQADLALSKTVDNPTPNVGDIITFIGDAHSNNGPEDTESSDVIDAQDPLPAGLALVSSNAIGGTYVASTGFWNVGTVTTVASR